jgi:hypothetical protein
MNDVHSLVSNFESVFVEYEVAALAGKFFLSLSVSGRWRRNQTYDTRRIEARMFGGETDWLRTSNWLASLTNQLPLEQSANHNLSSAPLQKEISRSFTSCWEDRQNAYIYQLPQDVAHT